eukprot:2010081-Amphidinium_carterae.3
MKYKKHAAGRCEAIVEKTPTLFSLAEMNVKLAAVLDSVPDGHVKDFTFSRQGQCQRSRWKDIAKSTTQKAHV